MAVLSAHTCFSVFFGYTLTSSGVGRWLVSCVYRSKGVVMAKKDNNSDFWLMTIVFWLMVLTFTTCTGLHEVADEIRMHRLFGK